MYFKRLAESEKTVFTVDDLKKIWSVDNANYLKVIINRLFQRKEIIRIHRGIYVLANKKHDFLELANKLKSPSYVSLETVLQKEGIVFQDQGSVIFSVSNNTLSKKAGNMTFRYFKLADEILSNPLGVETRGQVIIASPERALCDRLHLSPKYYFDNLRGLNAEKLTSISAIYNQRVKKEIQQIIKEIYAKHRPTS